MIERTKESRMRKMDVCLSLLVLLVFGLTGVVSAAPRGSRGCAGGQCGQPAQAMYYQPVQVYSPQSQIVLPTYPVQTYQPVQTQVYQPVQSSGCNSSGCSTGRLGIFRGRR